MGTFTTLLLNSRYSREFEHEAHMQASGWMLAADYAVEPMITFLERLKKSEKGAQLPAYFSSHPTLQNRVISLRLITDKNRDRRSLE